MSNDGAYDDATGDDFPELGRLQQQTWVAAAPYLAAAVLAWVGAGVAEYQLTRTMSQGYEFGQRAVQQTVWQVLSQALLYAGLGLFTVGLLVAALRQHSRWRRDCGQWLGDPRDTQDDVADHA